MWENVVGLVLDLRDEDLLSVHPPGVCLHRLLELLMCVVRLFAAERLRLLILQLLRRSTRLQIAAAIIYRHLRAYDREHLLHLGCHTLRFLHHFLELKL